MGVVRILDWEGPGHGHHNATVRIIRILFLTVKYI